MIAKPGQGSDEAAPAAGVPLDGFDEAHRNLLADPDIQFSLQPYQPPAPPPRIDLPATAPGWDLAPVLRVLFWIAIAFAAAVFLYLIVSRLTGWQLRWPWRRREEGLADEADWRPAEAPARRLLDEADALAAEGRFEEAAHLLLFRSIDDIAERRPDSLRPALTSRDIAGLPALPPSPAEAFARIVRAVERSLFGGQRLEAEDWRECRAAYERFAFAPEWGG